MKERDDGHVHLGLTHGFDGCGVSPTACTRRGIDRFGCRRCGTHCFRIGHQRVGARTRHGRDHDDDDRRRRRYTRRGVLGLRRSSASSIEQRRVTGRSGLVADRESCARLGSRQAWLHVVRVGRRAMSLEMVLGRGPTIRPTACRFTTHAVKMFQSVNALNRPSLVGRSASSATEKKRASAASSAATTVSSPRTTHTKSRIT